MINRSTNHKMLHSLRCMQLMLLLRFPLSKMSLKKWAIITKRNRQSLLFLIVLILQFMSQAMSHCRMGLLHLRIKFLMMRKGASTLLRLKACIRDFQNRIGNSGLNNILRQNYSLLLILTRETIHLMIKLKQKWRSENRMAENCLQEHQLK